MAGFTWNYMKTSMDDFDNFRSSATLPDCLREFRVQHANDGVAGPLAAPFRVPAKARSQRRQQTGDVRAVFLLPAALIPVGPAHAPLFADHGRVKGVDVQVSTATAAEVPHCAVVR